jgi:hypothetical protein
MKRLISSLAALVAVACLVRPAVKKARCTCPMTDQDPADRPSPRKSLPQAHKHDVYQ